MTADSPAPQGAAGEARERCVVLVADDSRVMRVALTRILKDEYTVLEAEHGEEAWAKLTAESGVQMVFSDLSMPELDGFGLLERIRGSELPRIRDVPFIVITGNEDDQGVRRKALARGATDFILKPFQSAEIKARAKAHADQSRRLQEASVALEQASTQDDATGLANRRFFTQRAGEMLSFGARQGLGVGLLSIQLDRWMAAVAEHGQGSATELLRAIGERLRRQLRHEDLLAHFGDGRFALLSPAATREGARQLAQRVLDAVRTCRLARDGAAWGVTASIGIAVLDDGASADVEHLLERADRLLAKAVRDGGDRVLEDDYVRAHAPAPSSSVPETLAATRAPVEPRAPVDASVVQRLRVELAEARQTAETRQVELEELQAQLAQERAAPRAEPGEVESLRRELEAEQDAHRARVQELEQARAQAERLRSELLDLTTRLNQGEEERQRLDGQLAIARGLAEQLEAEASAHAAELERERGARQRAESELAKLQLQDVARREAQRHAEEAAKERARRGLLARLLHFLRG